MHAATYATASAAMESEAAPSQRVSDLQRGLVRRRALWCARHTFHFWFLCH